MTWVSHGAKMLSLVIVLPLVLKKLPEAEITVWFLFSLLSALYLICDMGFVQTFSRAIAYAMGGAERIRIFNHATDRSVSSEVNWSLIKRLCSTMYMVYSRLLLIVFVLFLIGGSLLLVKPISSCQDSATAWLSWVFVLAGSTIFLFGNLYSAYLQGINQIALLRRVEAFCFLGSSLTCACVLLARGGLLGLVFSNQIWRAIAVVAKRYSCGKVENGRFLDFRRFSLDRDVFKAVWLSTWRSGLGIFMSYGLVQLSGLFYAQIEGGKSLASYLLGLRLIQAISQFSQAPFYSRIPIMARLNASGSIEKLIASAKRGMFLAHSTYVIQIVLMSIFGPMILGIIGSKVPFPDNLLWVLLTLAIFAERYGAMHIQLYSTTNHIVWHIANGVTGAIVIVLSLSLIPVFGITAFPLALLIANISFYSWYCARLSYKAFKIPIWNFEKLTFVCPCVVLGLFYFTLILIRM